MGGLEGFRLAWMGEPGGLWSRLDGRLEFAWMGGLEGLRLVARVLTGGAT